MCFLLVARMKRVPPHMHLSPSACHISVLCHACLPGVCTLGVLLGVLLGALLGDSLEAGHCNNHTLCHTRSAYCLPSEISSLASSGFMPNVLCVLPATLHHVCPPFLCRGETKLTASGSGSDNLNSMDSMEEVSLGTEPHAGRQAFCSQLGAIA